MKNKMSLRKYTIYTLSLSMCLSIFLQACVTKKKTIVQEIEKEKIVIPETIQPTDFTRNYIIFSHFEGKSFSEIKSPQLEQNFTVKSKLIHNNSSHLSIIASMLGMSMEVSQLYTTHDSVKVLDKINFQYTESDWKGIEKMLKMPINQTMFQNIIVGNPPIITQNFDTFERQNDKIMIVQTVQPYSQTLIYDIQTKKLEKIELSNASSSYRLTVTLAEYKTDAGSQILFPTWQQWHVTNGAETYQMQWNYEQFKFNNPVSIKFSIPFRYKKTNLN